MYDSFILKGQSLWRLGNAIEAVTALEMAKKYKKNNFKYNTNEPTRKNIE